MEEDSSSNSRVDPTALADLSSEKVVPAEDATPVERTSQSTSPNIVVACPVNPKKRLISQFSGTGDESVCPVSSVIDQMPSVPYSSTADEKLALPSLCPPDAIPPVAEQVAAEQCTSHSTPVSGMVMYCTVCCFVRYQC